MAAAWGEFRGPLNRPGSRWHKPFGHFLSYAWRTARFARQRRAEGALELERAAEAAREVLRQQLQASLTDEQIAANAAWLILQCSTDGPIREHRVGA